MKKKKHIIKYKEYEPISIDGIKVVQDEEEALTEILKGNQVCRFEYGDSMSPILENGEFAKLTPCKKEDVQVGDAVFCRVNGYLMIHMVGASTNDGKMFLITSSDLHTYGWTSEIFAKAESFGNDEYDRVFIFDFD